MLNSAGRDQSYLKDWTALPAKPGATSVGGPKILL
jgi:hypothetical protein